MTHNNPALAIQTHFGSLEDPRLDRTRLHDLIDVVVIAICAVICGSDGWVDIAKYGRAKLTWLRTFLRLPNGIPSVCWILTPFTTAFSTGSML
jgi:DDE_Tnp_1-associated